MTTIVATRFTSLLPTLRHATRRPITYPKPPLLALPCSRNYWSTTEPVNRPVDGEELQQKQTNEEDYLSQEKDAYDILLGDTAPVSSDPDLDIELPPSIFADRVQPPLINIPPQQDPLLSYLASRLMNHGHRQKASRIVSRTLLNIHAYTRAPPLPILRRAIFALAPAVRCLKHRHATKTIYKPVAVSEKQGICFAVTWLLEECKGRQGGPMVEERLAREIIKVLHNDSGALKKKSDMHALAMVNRYVIRSFYLSPCGLTFRFSVEI